MTSGNFARAFVAGTGMTPAKSIMRVRLEAARAYVKEGGEPIDPMAAATGFGDPERMRRAFVRSFGQPPEACAGRYRGPKPDQLSCSRPLGRRSRKSNHDGRLCPRPWKNAS